MSTPCRLREILCAVDEIAAVTTQPLQASQLAYSQTRVGDTLL